jgi:hypothetical protein
MINGEADIRLYNTIGQVLQQQTLSFINGKISGEVNLLPSTTDGIYQLEIRCGTYRWNEKIVIQR